MILLYKRFQFVTLNVNLSIRVYGTLNLNSHCYSNQYFKDFGGAIGIIIIVIICFSVYNILFRPLKCYLIGK